MKTCVYTVLLGGYDALLEQPVAADSSADFVCFTDDPTLESEAWTMVLVEPRFPQDLHRSSRVYKILGHPVLDDYDATLCIDASVRLRRPPEQIIESWLGEGHEIAVARHSYREQVVDEFDEVVRLNYDDRARVYEQLVDYALAYPDVLEAKPHWGGMIARRRSERVSEAMRLWFDHVLRYSRRDQLSLMVALLHGGADYRSMDVDNFSSEFHEWPVITERRISLGKAPALPSGPMIAELRRARRRIDELEEQLAMNAELLGDRTIREVLEAESGLRVDLEETRGALAALERAHHRQAGVRGASRHLSATLANKVRRTG